MIELDSLKEKSSFKMRSCLVGFKRKTKQPAMYVILYDGCVNNVLHVETNFIHVLVDLEFQICIKTVGMKLKDAKMSKSPESHCKSNAHWETTI